MYSKSYLALSKERNCLATALFEPIEYRRRALSHINPRTAGGGAGIRPLRFFADSEKTAARSAAKFFIAVQPTI